MEDLNRADRPPRPGPETYLRRIKGGEKVVLTCLANIWGVWCHWNGQTTVPCLANKDKCFGCQKNQPKRWRGYLHVWNHQASQDEFLELTALVAEAIEKLVPGNSDLRGFQFMFQRGKGDKARMRVDFARFFEDTANFPPAKEPEKTMRALWTWSDEQGKGNGILA